jgi:outer membrane protein TolC
VKRARWAAAALAAAALPGFGQRASIEPAKAAGNRWLQPYREPAVPAVRPGNSGRLGGLVKAGVLYLTAQDAIAAALENNIDLEIARYTPIVSAWRLERAKAGGALPGVSSNASQAGSVASGQGVTGSQSAAGVATGGGGGGAGPATNASISQIGPVTQNLDPIFQYAATFSHRTTPQANARQSQTTALEADTRVYSATVQQGFLTGGNVSLRFSENYLRENSPSSYLNPTYAPSLALSFQHNLARGFGRTVNSRTIEVSKLNLAMSDLTFKSRVIAVVNQALTAYYGLAAAREDLNAKQMALEVAQTLVANTKRQAEVGAIAETEVLRVEAQAASSRQALVASETAVEQQEVRLKNLLSRTGTGDPVLRTARIAPIDRIAIPEREELPALEQLVNQAREQRADLALEKSNLKASEINAAGTRNGLLPNVQVFGGLTQAGLAGPVQATAGSGGNSSSGYFVGGVGNALGQVFRRNFPSQRIGVFAQAPVGNHQAQADYTIDQLQIRQSELSHQKRLNQVEVDVSNSLVALRQARARYEAAQKNRALQAQLLEAEQKRYEHGVSTLQTVIQLQRDLASAQSAEVAALNAYSNAKIGLDQTLGRTLEANGVSLAEAKEGSVARGSAIR